MLTIEEIGNVHDRISTLVDYFCKGNKTAFGRGADIQSGVLAGITSGRRNKPSFDVVQKILTGYPTVNPMWLLFGRSPMILDGAELQDNLNMRRTTVFTPEQAQALITQIMPMLEEEIEIKVRKEFAKEQLGTSG